MKKITILSIILIIMITLPTVANAAFQSKPGATALVSTTADQFFEGCRNMETRGGVLGLTEVLGTDYTGTTGNGLDAHMILNTEWGAIALLTDSAYGIGKGIAGTSSTKTSTGNATGVNGMANGWEYTATTYSGTSSSYNAKLRGANACYFNSYSSQTSKKGDAINCSKWLSADTAVWISASYPVFKRGYGLFSFSYDNGLGAANRSSRAVVVCGSGL